MSSLLNENYIFPCVQTNVIVNSYSSNIHVYDEPD